MEELINTRTSDFNIRMRSPLCLNTGFFYIRGVVRPPRSFFRWINRNFSADPVDPAARRWLSPRRKISWRKFPARLVEKIFETCAVYRIPPTLRYSRQFQYARCSNLDREGGRVRAWQLPLSRNRKVESDLSIHASNAVSLAERTFIFEYLIGTETCYPTFIPRTFPTIQKCVCRIDFTLVRQNWSVRSSELGQKFLSFFFSFLFFRWLTTNFVNFELNLSPSVIFITLLIICCVGKFVLFFLVGPLYVKNLVFGVLFEISRLVNFIN